MTFAFAMAMAGTATLVGAAQPWFRLKVPESVDGSSAEVATETRKGEEKVVDTASTA